MSPELVTALTAGLVILGLLWERARVLKGRAMVAAWMREHGYVPTRIEPRWVRRGPFFILASRYQMVYRLEATDIHSDEHRSGWARVGSWWFGLLKDQVEVRWDSPARQLERGAPRRLVLAPTEQGVLGTIPRTRPAPRPV